MLTIRPNVKLNEALSKVIWDIAPYSGQVPIEVTSGVREPIDQLHLISWYALQKGVKFPEFRPQELHEKVQPVELAHEVYRWQRTWSRLLHLGVIINPPLAAVCLEDSLRGNGTNRKGEVIQGSPHSRGTAFDISGKAGFKAIESVLRESKAAGVGIKDWLIERENNAVHVNILV